jgi:chromosome segregation ATPase
MRCHRTVSGVAAIAPVLLLAVGAGPGPAFGQASPEVVARLQSMLQEATRARARLERDNAKLTRDVEKLEQDVETLEAERRKLKSQLDAAQNTAAALREVGEDWKSRYGDLRAGWDKMFGGCMETVYIMRDIERERADFVERLAARNASLAACSAANDELLALNEEILSRYEDDGRGGILTSVAEREPFVKLSRVQLENAIDDYRFRASEHEFFAPEALPLVSEAGAQTIDGRWQCSLVSGEADAL